MTTKPNSYLTDRVKKCKHLAVAIIGKNGVFCSACNKYIGTLWDKTKQKYNNCECTDGINDHLVHTCDSMENLAELNDLRECLVVELNLNNWSILKIMKKVRKICNALLTSEVERVKQQAIGIVNEKVRWAKGANPDEIYELINKI